MLFSGTVLKVCPFIYTAVSFKLAELNDYRTREEDDFVVVSVAKNPSIKLAKPVSLMISPLTLEEAATRGFRRSIADGSVSATGKDKVHLHACVP